ncbi:hypothetical protein SMSP2_02883 [Limihaloglobus sulfuriphilus]|uniref:Right handed beta helix domain-containing protein n=1 Tax=Limihaloglobus sulfuriphilus TaxID=1851148 RepID=A0A1Q2MJA0_9BACT|nr:carboxypeptidase-like regulatory domain-containing protein [Limihaloglobus sulfuriphilus]AQQ72497.1 hypothetical protein SMSP2_02883 [Limihaloglobus sulfuriphilus]
MKQLVLILQIFVLLASVTCFEVVAGEEATTIIYLDGSRNRCGEGSSWEDACSSFDAAYGALQKAVKNEGHAELWITAGTYKIAPVVITQGMYVFGGFKGCEDKLSQRDPFLTTDNATVLQVKDPKSDLITVSGCRNVRLDGLVLKGIRSPSGNASAMRVVDCDGDVSFKHCLFTGNVNADGGPAAVIHNSNVSFMYCLFSDNRIVALKAGGGAVRITGNSSPQFHYSTFSRNSADAGFGGAVYIDITSDCRLLFCECNIVSNKAKLGAGAMYIKNAVGGVRLYESTVVLNRTMTPDADEFSGAVHIKGNQQSPARLEIDGFATCLSDNYVLAGDGKYDYVDSVSYGYAVIDKDKQAHVDHLKSKVADRQVDESYFDKRPDTKEYRQFLHLPPMVNKKPAAGCNVKYQFEEFSGTGVYHSVFLPSNWQPGGKYPVIMDIPGNPFEHYWGDISSGRPESSPIGYGVSNGKAICIGLPCISPDGNSHVRALGDVKQTVAYMKKVAVWVSREMGGDPARMILTGYSRGGQGTAFLGRYDDEIADIWLGWLHYDGFDMPLEPHVHMRKYSYNVTEDDYRVDGNIIKRFARIKGRSTFIVNSGYVNLFEAYNKKYGFPCEHVLTGSRNHNPDWSLMETETLKQARQWYSRTLIELTGTGQASGIVTDTNSRPVQGAVVYTGLTRFASTGNDGRFVFEGLPVGPREFVLVISGKTQAKKQITIKEGLNSTVKFD